MSTLIQSITARVNAVYVKLATGAGAGLVGYLRTAVNAVARTLQAKSDDHVSVADFATVQDAVTDVFTNGGKLWVPRGNWALPASVAHLHDIVTYGPGAFTRAGKTWYAEPFWNQTNTIFVDVAAGNDANDGIAPGAGNAVKTIGRALAILGSKGPWLNGTWALSILDSGAYPESVTFPENLRGLNRVQINGVAIATPGVPTVVMDGGGALPFGINFNGNNKVIVNWIKLQNYTTYGVVCQDLCDITLNNCHAAGVPNGPGFKAQQSRLRVQGGDIGTCQTGINCIGATTFTIGDPAGASTANGTRIHNCVQQALLAQEQSSGHCDYVTADNCAVGFDLTVHSRVHAASCVVINNATAGVRCQDASSWYDNGTSANFAGNGADELMYGSSGEIGRDGARTSVLWQQTDQVAVINTGSTTNNVVKTYAAAISKNSFNSPVKAWGIDFFGTVNGVLGAKTFTVTLAGVTLFTFVLPAAALSFDVEVQVSARNANSQRVRARAFSDTALIKDFVTSTAIATQTGAPLQAQILIQNATSTDQPQILEVDQWNSGGC